MSTQKNTQIFFFFHLCVLHSTQTEKYRASKDSLKTPILIGVLCKIHSSIFVCVTVYGVAIISRLLKIIKL